MKPRSLDSYTRRVRVVLKIDNQNQKQVVSVFPVA